MELEFPPPLTIGNRVWTIGGYYDHGPLDGPKTDIVPNMGGTITATESPYHSSDSLLYTIHWDNGQISKHYANGLFCIGRFQTRSEFEAAIKLSGPVELTVGPQGGFRHARVRVEYDGHPQEAEIHDRSLWIGCVERLARENTVAIHTIALPGRSRRKSQA
jgi:hypothetical protein